MLKSLDTIPHEEYLNKLVKERLFRGNMIAVLKYSGQQ